MLFLRSVTCSFAGLQRLSSTSYAGVVLLCGCVSCGNREQKRGIGRSKLGSCMPRRVMCIAGDVWVNKTQLHSSEKVEDSVLVQRFESSSESHFRTKRPFVQCSMMCLFSNRVKYLTARGRLQCYEYFRNSFLVFLWPTIGGLALICCGAATVSAQD